MIFKLVATNIATIIIVLMNVSFFLWKSKKSKKTGMMPLYVMVNHNGECIRKPVKGVKLLEKYWDQAKQKVLTNIKSEDYNNSNEFNYEINLLTNRLNKLWSKSFVSEKKISSDDIIETIKYKHEEEYDEKEVDLISGFERFIEQNKSHRANRTIIGYGSTLHLFRAFKKDTSYDVRLSNINLEFFDAFRNYCFDVKKYKNNTFSKTINDLKAFMNWGEDRGIHSNPVFRKFKASEESIEVIFLTHSELVLLNNFEFKSKRLSQARDIYCFSCFTGLRYSDLANLQNANIFEDHMKINVHKTRAKDLVIPLIGQAKDILKKYEGTVKYPLPMISSQKLNQYIKEACKEAKIDSPVTITRYSGNKKIEKTIKKHDLLTLHTGRKTFVTNSLILGLTPFQVKQITGHKSDSSFMKYVHVSNEQKIQQLNSAWDNF